MGSKHKHKKHKSERREKYEDRPFCLERPPSLKLILKVGGGNSSTPEYGSSESPVYGVQPENLGLLMDYPERHKKSKKKKKKKDREKKHKHHKEKRRNRDDSNDRAEANENSGRNECDESSQEDFSVNDDSSQYHAKFHSAMDSQSPASVSSVRPPLLSLKSPDVEPFTPPSVPLTSEPSPGMSSVRSDSMKSPSSMSDASSREPRTCVLKLKQSKSPLTKLLNHLLKLLEKKDAHHFFAWPVTDEIAPGYSSIISHPMDFHTIRQKVEDSQYNSVQEFCDDFRLMCENAIKYNHVETVYHKAAKKLLQVGAKMLQPDHLMRTFHSYMQDLGQMELGFDLTQNAHDDEMHGVDSADEGMSTGAEEVNLAQLEEDEKRRNIRSENEPKSRFEPFVDDLTPDEILAQVQSAAEKVKRLSARKRAMKMGFLRQRKDGTTSMEILVDADNSCPERVVSLGAFIGKLQQGTGKLQGFRKDRRNNVKVVKPLNYGTYCSFAPIYDSRFANLSKEESELVLNTYGDDLGSEYSASIMEFTKDSQQANALANSLLDFLTNGEHRKTMERITENSRQKYEQYQVEQTFPDPVKTEDKQPDDVPIDFNSLRTLSELGVDVTFLDGMEDDFRTIEAFNEIKGKLTDNAALIERLNQVQHERLSQPLPTHLAHVAHPTEDEIELAHQITSNITEMAKQMPPKTLVTPHALRKAMGVSNVGLPPIIPSNHHPVTADISHNNMNGSGKMPSSEQKSCKDIDTTPIPMELEPELSSSCTTGGAVLPQASAASNAALSLAATQDDIENELREFLESGSAGLTTADNVGIEQMLMD